jgi:signal transduction histidine kinase
MSEGSRLGRLVGAIRAWPPIAIDVALAVVVFTLSVFPAVRQVPVDWRVIVADLVTAVPLVWRRRFPVLVALLAGVGTMVLAILHEVPRLPYGQLVATYTFADRSGPRMRLVGAVGTAAGFLLSLVGDEDPFGAASSVGMAFVTAYALGASAQCRRDRIAMLEERGARLVEQRELAAAAERERIARDMHDILVHSVTLMVVQAEGGGAVLDVAPDKAKTAFDTISATGREALTQLRRTLGVLRGGKGSRHPQPHLDAIPGLVARARGADLDVTLRETGEPRPVPAPLGVATYRIVQEALTNTVKHAGARHVDVRLTWLPSALRVEVVDDGRGPGGHTDDGHGLVGMRERVGACGGELSAGPGPGGRGFQITATLPVTTDG